MYMYMYVCVCECAETHFVAHCSVAVRRKEVYIMCGVYVWVFSFLRHELAVGAAEGGCSKWKAGSQAAGDVHNPLSECKQQTKVSSCVIKSATKQVKVSIQWFASTAI